MKDSIFRRKAQRDFDIDAALFSVTELAQVSGISRSAIDMYLHRGVLIPTRRARTLSPTRNTKVRGWKTAQGRPMFSVIIIFKARLIWELGNTLGLGPSESSLASDEALRTEIPARELEEENVAEIAAGRNWMWACARSVETKQPINIYAYAARSADRWLFDMHLGEKGAIPCFGLQVPHVYVPISEIFISVYNECKKILGVTGAQGPRTHKSGRAMRSR
jgi:hypothetical protein